MKSREWDVPYWQNPEKNDLFWKSVVKWDKPFSYNRFRNTLSLLIEQFNSKHEKVLLASQIGKGTDFISATILKSFFKHPLMTFRIIFGIHYQAMRIFFKGGKYYSRNKKPIDTISFEGKL